MQVHHRGLEDVQLDASAITIGSFDGVHLGHQMIIEKLTGYARKHSLPSIVVTFFPHPVVVLRNLQEPYYLTFPDQKASILFELGIDQVITIPFTRELSGYTPYQFMDWLNSHLHHKYMFVGKDFALGKDRKGDPETLKEIGRTMGYGLETVSSVEEQHERVSSSQIRRLLREGNVENAAILLGRSYSFPISMKTSEKTENIIGTSCLVELTYDSMQLLPAPGIYLANFINAGDENGSVIQCIVMVPSTQDHTSTNILALLPNPARESISDSAYNLTFISRIRDLQPEMNGSGHFQQMQADLNLLLERGRHDE